MTSGRRAGEVRGDEEARAEQQRRRDHHARGLAELLGRRPDLAGVHARADWAAESLRWTA